MTDLEKQVQRARRRITWQKFLSVTTWTTLISLIVAAVAILARKLYPLALDGDIWNYSWFGGAIVIGLVTAVIWVLSRRYSNIDAAIEIDRRYGLKERVASSLSLAPDEQESEIGRALVKDATRRVGRVDVTEHFQVRPSRWSLVPIALGVGVFCLAFFVEDAKLQPKKAQATTNTTKTQIKKSTEALAKRIAEKKKQAEEKNLPEADKKLLTEIQQAAKQLAENNKGDRKSALRKLSEMSKEIKRRKDSIGSGDELRKQLKDLQDIKKGPADKIAQAMKDGDFQMAKDAMNKLRDKLANDKLSDEEKKDLKEQLQQMKDRMQQMADAHEKAKEELEKQIQEKIAQGDMKAANDLQQKLDGMNAGQNQMNQLQEMADKMQQAADALDADQIQQAMEQLDELGESLDDLQQMADQLEMLDEAMDQISMAQEAMT